MKHTYGDYHLAASTESAREINRELARQRQQCQRRVRNALLIVLASVCGAILLTAAVHYFTV